MDCAQQKNQKKIKNIDLFMLDVCAHACIYIGATVLFGCQLWSLFVYMFVPVVHLLKYYLITILRPT